MHMVCMRGQSDRQAATGARLINRLHSLEDLAAAVDPPRQQPLRVDFRQVAGVPAEGLWGVVLLWPGLGCVPPAGGIKRSVVAHALLPILRLPTHAGGRARCRARQGVRLAPAATSVR